MDQLDKVIDIMNEDFANRGKTYYVVSVEFDEGWDHKLNAFWVSTTNELMQIKYIIDRHLEIKIEDNL